jgi:glucokinase
MVRIGIDVGGTGIQIGVVDRLGNILQKGEVVTRTDLPFEEQIAQMAACCLDTLTRSGHSLDELESIGAGVPGVANQATGVIPFCTNLGWHDVPFRTEFQKHINKPVYIDNDATVAGLAESVAGVSAGTSSSVFITLGTGVGGGIVINGRPWAGAHGRGGEIGHMTLVPDGAPCTCGNNGCVERYCSATALIRMGRQECRAFPDSLMLKKAGGDPKKISAKTVIDAAKEGDAPALRAFNSFVYYLALTINNLTASLDPEMIVLGGGVSHAGAFLLDAVRALLPRYQIFKALPIPKVELAQLGNEAGIIGAAMLGKR